MEESLVKEDKYYSDKDFFELRFEDFAYISKTFPGQILASYQKRFIQKKFVFDEEVSFEKTRIKGEYILRSSPSNRLQLKVVLTQDSHEIESIIIQNFNGSNPQGECVSFHNHEFLKLLDFLDKIKFIDLENKNTFRLKLGDIDTSKVLIDSEYLNILESIKNTHGADRDILLENLSNGHFTKEDLEVLSGRRKGLEEFSLNLKRESDWDEKDWQKFFNENTWIFGYGLDYQFLNILQKEAHISDIDLDSKNDVITDFLLGSSKFTVIVELKRPDTPIFTTEKNRSESWQLSHELTKAVSQILAQKAEWEIKSKMQQYDSFGKALSNITIDPKAILIIGDFKQFDGSNKNDVIKQKTFELYRRNLRNIEIITYSELYERAFYIVNQRMANLNI